MAYELYKSRSQKLVLQKRFGKKPPYVWPIKTNGCVPAVFNSEEFFALVRTMRRREVGDLHRLDIPATISATIEAVDYPSLCYKPDSKQPEYLILIERTSYSDHQAELFNLLVKRLEQEGVLLMRYFYEDDPRICETETEQASLSLTKLQERFPGHRLIIFSNGEKMINPITGRLKPWVDSFSKWRYRVLATNEVAAQWGLREKLLARHFLVLPANINGLLTFADYFERGVEPELKSWHREMMDVLSDEFDQPEKVEVLRSFLGDQCFQWLCACAVYSELQWDLTLHLGSLPIIGEDLLTEANLLKLTRLPWFRSGSLPDDLRTLLINELGSEKVESVRSIIIDLLEKSSPPEGSYAASTNELDLVIQRHLLQARSSNYEDLLSGIRGSKAHRSYTALRAFKNRLKSALDIELPGSLRNRLSPFAIREIEREDNVKQDVSQTNDQLLYDLGRHPKGLYVLFIAEMCERFSFYSMLALFTLYLQDADQGFGWSSDAAISLYANYLLFVYAGPLFGGWLADKKLGYHKAVMIGGFFFLIGHLLLSVQSLLAVYAALVCLVIGNSLFKPNISIMVGNIYPEGSHLKDHAYNIFYMGINIGAFLAPLVMEIIKPRWGYSPSFAIAALVMLISISLLWWFRSYLGTQQVDAVEGYIVGQGRKSVALSVDASPKSITSYGIIDVVSQSRRIAALVVIYTIIIVFWMVFHQNGSTLTFWADENTDWEVSGIVSNVINPFWVIALTFPLVWFWKWLDRKGKEPSTPTKMAIGITLTGLSFFILYFAAKAGEATAPAGNPNDFKVSPIWLIVSYGVVSLGELMLSPMGLSLVSKVAPARMRGLMMGGWFLATAIGNKLTMIGIYWDEWLHSTFFALLGASALFMALVLLILLKPLKKAMPGV